MAADLSIHFSSRSTEWETPQELYEELNDIFQFDLDAAACKYSAKCEDWFGPGSKLAEDAMQEDWEGVVWLNPPYGRGIIKWVQKAYEESLKGATVVMLVPARPDTKWFQICWKAPIITFVTGRIRFGGSETPAPFPSCIVVFSQNLPYDVELNNLSRIGTIVRTLWHYQPVSREPKFDIVETEPLPGVKIRRYKARDPEYRYLEPKLEE
jgi:phage N-6-adenine-methyltransferase